MTSQINPNNIDGTYPVAGVPNNTQGMRDNFTNTKTNFQYAADELTELQSKAILKAAITGTTLDNNMNNQEIYAVQLRDVSYAYSALTATAGSINIDYSVAPFQQINLSGPISLSFSNWPTAGTAGTVRVGFNITNVNQTVTLPASVSQGVLDIAGINPGTPGVSNTITFGSVGNYAFEFVTIDGGTTIWVFDDSRPANKFFSTVNVANATISTSTTTGALIVAGGVGIGGNLNVGGISAFTGNITGNLSVTGNIVAGNIASAGLINAVGVSSSGNIASAGRIQSTSPSGGVGYATGAGGTVSQSGNKSTGVTLNTASGQITMQNTSLAAATTVSFTLTNSNLDGTDLMVINQVSGGTAGAYTFNAACNTGSAVISVRNVTAGPLSEALVLRFAVIKGATS
jgi:hypothetical protein